MTDKSKWIELETQSKQKCPKLFYHFSHQQGDIKLYFTDLIGLWASNQSYDDVLSYARKHRTSIDPSESRKQLSILVERLQQSLFEGTNEITQTTTSNEEQIQLKTRLDLPKPLKPLRWTFCLRPQGPTEMAEQILRPCLHEASEAQRKIESLHEVIRDKDIVISKLIDKIEGSTLDLGLIFPSLTGSRARNSQVTVKDAQKRVSGVAAFDPARWHSRFDSDNDYGTFNERGLSKLMAGCEKCPTHAVEQHDRWLRNLPEAAYSPPSSPLLSPSQRRAKGKRRASSSSDNSTATESEGSDFMRQPTPPTLQTRSPIVERISDREKPAQKKRRTASSSPPARPSKQTAQQRNSSASSATSSAASQPPSPSPARVRLLPTKPQPTQSHHIRQPSSSPQPPSSPSLPPFPTTRASTPPPLSVSKPNANRLSSPISTPRRLGRLSSSRPPSSPNKHSTPQHNRVRQLGSKDPNSSDAESRGASGTPSRRLGRLGSWRSQSQAQTQGWELGTVVSDGLGELEQVEGAGGGGDGEDSDSTVSGNGYDEGAKDRKGEEAPKIVEEVKVETEEEKAQRRREELKRKVAPPTNARKKRKF